MTEETNSQPYKIPIRTIKGTIFKHPGEIIYIEAHEGYSQFYIRGQDKPLRSTQPLAAFKDNLPDQFFTCHRSFIINLRLVDMVEKDNRSIHLEGGHTVRMSKEYSDAFIKLTAPPYSKK